MVLASRSKSNGAKSASPKPDGIKQKWVEQLSPFLAPTLRTLVLDTTRRSQDLLTAASEIRIRSGRPLALSANGRDILLREVTTEEVIQTLHLMSDCSVYALEEEFRQGYLTLPGGHRVGLAGRVVLEAGKVKTIYPVSSLNIRIARQLPGVADEIIPKVISAEDSLFFSTLIVSPPGCGKTTLLRDMVRQLSTGRPELGLAGVTVGLVDERSEIAACYRGIPQNDVGPRTDVLDGCPKSEGLLRMLRSLSPKVLATDELGKMEDVQGVEEAVHSGVMVMATAHGHSLDDLSKRPAMREMMKLHVFQRFVFLSRRRYPGTLEGIFDQEGRPLYLPGNVPKGLGGKSACGSS